MHPCHRARAWDLSAEACLSSAAPRHDTVGQRHCQQLQHTNDSVPHPKAQQGTKAQLPPSVGFAGFFFRLHLSYAGNFDALHTW